MDFALSGFKRARQVVREAASLLFATECLACGVLARDLLCDRCREHRELGVSVCDLCGRPTSAPIRCCGVCAIEKTEKDWHAGRSLWWLDDAARAWIAAVKFEGRFELVEALAPQFKKAFCWRPDVDVVVPIPLHPFRLASRGFNQSEKIAGWVAGALGKPLVADVLLRHAHTQPQSLLRRTERLTNLAGVFALKDASLRRAKVLLVDDIWTSGSTLRDAARTVKGRVSVFSLFRTPVR